jgi:uncharacterized protein (DUF983 family)
MNDQVFGGEAHSGRTARPLWTAMARGLLGRCPNCGKGKLFASYLTVVKQCDNCGEVMHHHRADDLPAYLVVVIVGHVVVGAFMSLEAASNTLSLGQQLAIWIPLSIALAAGLLRPVKGAVVGLQWALYMHGFGGEPDHIETHPEA